MFGSETVPSSAPLRSGGNASGHIRALPSQLIRWLSVDRATMGRAFRGNRPSDRSMRPGSVQVMLPSSPLVPDSLFTASMGPLPREDIIGEFTDLFRDACRRKDPEVRSESALWFYSDPRNFDQSSIGGIVPSAVSPRTSRVSAGSLVILGGPPEIQGLQVFGTIEVLGPGDEVYEFLLQAERLFMKDEATARCAPGSALLFRVG